MDPRQIALNHLAELRAADERREYRRAELQRLTDELRMQGVAYFDSDDDFSFEFSLRDLYLPCATRVAQNQIHFNLFVGWELSNETARAFLDIVQAEARIVAMAFLDMLHQAGGYSTYQLRLLVAPVRLRAEAQDALKGIVSHYWLSNLQQQTAVLDDARQEYVQLIGPIGLAAGEALARTTCFMEACYPLDASGANLQNLAADPDRHARLLQPFLRSDALAQRLCLFLISDNCD
jgi:hypothetical protein